MWTNRIRTFSTRPNEATDAFKKLLQAIDKAGQELQQVSADLQALQKQCAGPKRSVTPPLVVTRNANADEMNTAKQLAKIREQIESVRLQFTDSAKQADYQPPRLGSTH